MQGEMVMAGNLGGFIAGGDPATYFPEMWKWVVEEFKVKTVHDIGCGEGHALKYFRDVLGCRVAGLDGIEQPDPDIITHDFENGSITNSAWPNWPITWETDLIWSCEFLEHVEEKYTSNMYQSFKRGKIVLVTHAFPGQLGHHHVNCRDSEYWKGVFAGWGFQFDQGLTDVTRSLARRNEDPNNHYARAGMAFRRP